MTALDFSLVPNPAETTVEIWYANPQKSSGIKIEIYSLGSQLMHAQDVPATGEYKGVVRVDVKDWPLGQYYVTIKTGREVKTKTLMTIK
ncbi:MAG TPA: T9SS type A sorting domain-containing protein [Saprospiraceae bacterium]|nr:T9SS type A sorting domain-containing protein [Saprospiraceae bacterium]